MNYKPTMTEGDYNDYVSSLIFDLLHNPNTQYCWDNDDREDDDVDFHRFHDLGILHWTWYETEQVYKLTLKSDLISDTPMEYEFGPFVRMTEEDVINVVTQKLFGLVSL